MRIRPDEAALGAEEWWDYLLANPFGQLVTTPPAGEYPLVVPAHFDLRGDLSAPVVGLHFARANPVWTHLANDDRATLAVVGHYAFVPSAWNAVEGQAASSGVPTSYYAAVQLRGRVRVIEDPAALAILLTTLTARFQPEGGHAAIAAESGPYARLLRGIRGLELEVDDVSAKFKFGGNRTPDHQRAITARLRDRGTPRGVDVAAYQLSRLSWREREDDAR